MSEREQRRIWDDLYKGGLSVSYPWSLVVSTFRSRALFGPLQGKSVLEYGCGDANNMQFFADAGMRAFGFDFSETSISNGAAKLRQRGYDVIVTGGSGGGFDERYAERAVGSATLAVCDFASFRTSLTFDFVLDRAALCCAGRDELPGLIQRIHDHLAVDGLFVFTPYTDRHPSNPAHGWKAGYTPEPIGEFAITYLSYNDVTSLLRGRGWSIERLREVSEVDPVSGEGYRNWLVVARKLA